LVLICPAQCVQGIKEKKVFCGLFIFFESNFADFLYTLLGAVFFNYFINNP
jgi:hypothetical protein